MFNGKRVLFWVNDVDKHDSQDVGDEEHFLQGLEQYADTTETVLLATNDVLYFNCISNGEEFVKYWVWHLNETVKGEPKLLIFVIVNILLDESKQFAEA